MCGWGSKRGGGGGRCKGDMIIDQQGLADLLVSFPKIKTIKGDNTDFCKQKKTAEQKHLITNMVSYSCHQS